MAITKSSSTFRGITNHTIEDQSFLKTFNVLLDHDRITHFMNIFKSYEFNKTITSDVSFYYTYEVEDEEWWDNISVKYYNTPLLWWVVAAFNNVVNPFEAPISGSNIKILKSKYIYSLLRDLDIIAGM